MKTSNLLVVCDNPENVYVQQLRRRYPDLTRVNSLRGNDLTGIVEVPATILIINKGRGESEQALSRWPQSKILLAHGGGQKDFLPLLVSLRPDGNDDYENYGNWTEFFKLVEQNWSWHEKFISYLNPGEYELLPLVPEPSSAEQQRRLAENFRSALRCSSAYLGWLQQWAEAVADMRFRANFYYDAKKKIKTLSVPLPTKYLVYQGKNIFAEEDEVSFILSDGDHLKAQIKSVSEEGLVVFLARRQSGSRINLIQGFSVRPNVQMIKQYQRYCRETDYSWRSGDPLKVLLGEHPNSEAMRSRRLNLNTKEQKVLSDQSETKALAKILGPDYITIVEGPPGTGKTFLTALAIKQMIEQGETVLVTSHANHGLDNILEQVADLLPASEHHLLFRLGNNPDSVSTNNLRFHRSKKYHAPPADPQSQEKLDSSKIDGILSALEYQGILQITDHSPSGAALFVTLNSLVLDTTMTSLEESISLDAAFIDKATKGYLHELLPLLLSVKNKLVLIGDHRQLGNIALPEEAKQSMREEYGLSYEEVDNFAAGFFTNLTGSQLLSSNLLTINRRSLVTIANLVSQAFYQG
jgi:hypothetical protein